MYTCLLAKPVVDIILGLWSIIYCYLFSLVCLSENSLQAALTISRLRNVCVYYTLHNLKDIEEYVYIIHCIILKT